MTCSSCGAATGGDNTIRSGKKCWPCRVLDGETGWLTRIIMLQRGISLQQVADEMPVRRRLRGKDGRFHQRKGRGKGVSKQFLQRLLSDPASLASTKTGKALNEETLQLRYDDVDHAITVLTDQRGGVYATTGSTEAGAIELGRMIQGKGDYTRIRNKELQTA